ncbi:hypothetical protein [Geminicoccus harenae]|uniref:hypothetical protein n=2 Tax=Geminicoccus harenae TaxID=2498453 RepID=UPI001C96F21D|nr:hypothetical protein [Geminicoccus harenae]
MTGGADLRLDPARRRGEAIEIEVTGGVRILAANDLGAMASWVMFEQEDWYEPEHGWLRRLVRPGWRVLDTAPGCGILPATLTGRVGPSGAVLACDPLPAGHARLQAIRAGNRLDPLTPLLARIASPEETGAAQPATTLDRLAADHGPFELVRLGSDPLAMLAGSRRLLESSRPILVLPIGPADGGSAGEAGLLLQEHGYALHHLLPGFGAAAPLDAGFLDDFTTNLIACPLERQAGLAERGLLAHAEELARAELDVPPLPGPLAPGWPDLVRRIEAGLAAGLPLPARIAWTGRLVRAWLGGLRDFVDLMDRPARLTTLAALLAATGARGAALEAMRPLLHLLQAGQLRLDEPFLPILPRADQAGDADGPARWELAMAADAPETAELGLIHATARLVAHSGFHGGAFLYPWLNRYRHSRAFTPELERRRQLFARRLGEAQGFEPSPAMLRSRNARFAQIPRRAA